MTFAVATEQKRTREKKQLVIDLYGPAHAIVRKTCKGAGISRETFYAWKRRDADFALALREAVDRYLAAFKSDTNTRNHTFSGTFGHLKTTLQ